MAATASLTASVSPSIEPLSGLAAGPEGKRTKRIRVPPKISLSDLTPNNIGTLRKINSVLFPVRYSDKFYKEVLSPELEDYNKLVYYNDIPVGAICCRVELDSESKDANSKTSSSSQPTGKLYLMTLGVLAPYRRQGLATRMLEHVYAKATEASLAASLTPPPSSATTASNAANAKVAKDKKDKGKGKAADTTVSQTAPTPAAPILKSIFVHVQTSNEDSKTFWQQQGFKEKETIRDYYKPDVQPRDAWVLEKEIEIHS